MHKSQSCCRRLATVTQRLAFVGIAWVNPHRWIHTTVQALTQQQQGYSSSSMKRYNTAEFYKAHRRHPALFTDTFEEGWLHADMIELVKIFVKAVGEDDSEDPRDLASAVLRVEAPEVYSFRCFSETFLSMFKEELHHFYEISEKYNLDVRRPNSMNNYGVIVNEIGMRPMITSFQQIYLWPLARILFPRQGSKFDDHHSFIVRYSAEEDLGLDMHVDDSDVTFNVCLGDENFTGATLSFCGMFGEPNHRKLVHTYSHEIGRAVVHLGSRRHGADDIQSGTRANLIVWNHNFAWRASPEYRRRRTILYQREEGPPDATCLSYTHDRDYPAYKSYPAHTKDQNFRGWCPPEGYEYENFPDLSTITRDDDSTSQDKEL